MLFGGWVQTYFGDQSVDPTMSPVMVMIGGLNFLALLYGAINVTYTSAHMSLNAAATGHIFGKLSSYAPLRVGIALASITPMVASATSGSYVSVGQVSGMYVIVHGAGAADLFWRAGVAQYIALTNATQVKPLSKNVFSSGETLTSMLMCTEYLSMTNPAPLGPAKYTIKARKASGIASASQIYKGQNVPKISDVKQYYQSMPQYQDDIFLQNPMTSNIVTDMVIEFAGGSCGSLRLSMVPKTTSASAPVDKAAYYANYYSIDAILRHIANVASAVNSLSHEIQTADIAKYVTAYSKYDISHYKKYLLQTKNHLDIAQEIYQSHVNLSYCHSQVVKRAFAGEFNKKWQSSEASVCSSSSGNNVSISVPSNNGLLDQLTEGGWILAAASFSRMNGMMQMASSQAVFSLDQFMSYRIPERGSFCEHTDSWYSGIVDMFSSEAETLDDKIDSANECRPYFAVSEGTTFLWQILRESAENGDIKSSWSTAQSSGNWVDMLSLTERNDAQGTPLPSNKGAIIGLSSSILATGLAVGNSSNNLASGIADPRGAGIDYDGALFDVSGQTNALTLLATLGEALKILHTMVLTYYSLTTQSAETLASSALTGGFGIPLKFMSIYVLPLLVSSLSGAFLLANVLPMVPVITFVFIVTAFLIICAEALGGIALGSALLASAVGEGLLAVHGLRMAALYGAIFLRPSLHVIGLMLGFAMCNISYAIFNAIWWKSLGATTTNSWDLFDLVMITGGMPLVLTGLMFYCLKAPNLYANNLMSWVATEAVGQFGDTNEYIESAKGSMKAITGAFDAGVKQANEGSKGNGSNSQAPRQPSSNSQTENGSVTRPPSGTK
ncbi:hypothetical protein OCT63_19535 [Vibrio sp. RW]|uniref:hypothetical protein n=1 Tax=Vibrio sp. RW TaxID=2998833 RepID=UPI0022CD2048|nr:hypothetical protein [Vibrio sp. RW]MDA0146422.1 hypothetical protein [Vibrio sp. RW]